MERVVIAEILRPRGRHGEVLAQSTTDVPGRLEKLKEAQVLLSTGVDLPVGIEQAWPHGEHWVLKFSGVDSISDADRFRGADLWVAPDQRGQLPEGEFFRSDLLGCVLVAAEGGAAIGTVQGFEEYGGPLLLAVKTPGCEALVPFVPEICRRVDLEQRQIVVELPQGLLEL